MFLMRWSRGRDVVAPCVEAMEARTLCAGGALVGEATTGHIGVDGGSVTIAGLLTLPAVASTTPATNAVGVPVDVFVSADLRLPNGGIDPETLTADTVY